ncbi:MAG: LCP family protein [Clostridia bacterium]|nr:LCP family protein [Clostridia bacterium]
MDKTKKTMKRKTKRTLCTVIITLIMFFSAFSGVYCARMYTMPYSSNIIKTFDEDTLEEVEISKEKCNILIMGTDKSGMLTDVMMLMQIDPIDNNITVMSIPRDSRVNYKGSWMKLNSVHANAQKQEKSGSEAAIIAIKDLTGIPINHFVKINFTAFEKSIDELGGVDFNVPQRMKYKDPYQDLDIDLKPGMQHLDGNQAEQLVRFRQYTNGDIDRIKVQQDLIHAIADQKLKLKYVGKVDNIYRIIAKDMETSMSIEDVVQISGNILDIGGDKIVTITMPNTPQYIGNVSYVIPEYGQIDTVRREYFAYDSEGNDIERKK